MISFRYHVVTIVAIFVALAVGILMGTTLLDQGLVSDLQHRTSSLSSQLNQLTHQAKEAQDQAGLMQSFAAGVRPLLVGGRLAGSRVVLVTEEGVDPSDLSAVRQTLSGSGGAGATIDAVLVLGQRLSLDNDQTRQQVASILGRNPSESASRLADALARSLALRLTSGTPGVAGATDLLQTLVEAKLLTLSDAREGPSAVGGGNVSVVILSGTATTPGLSPEGFFVPFIQQLVTSGTRAAAVEPSTATSGFLDAVRSDDQADGQIVTVDDVELVPGQVALVWGLQELAAGKGGGDYGIHCGSCSQAPFPSSTP
jgi:hypothetical protein